jgi:lipid II:glycine glycyltransferase (peptidoglycan interpeptide bridge formation enzyme)
MQEITNPQTWDNLVAEQGGHPLQLWGWGELKGATGHWIAHRLYLKGAGGAQVLIRQLPAPFKALAYVPRGPFLHNQKHSGKVVEKLAEWAKQQGCLELKIEPDTTDFTQPKGWRVSKNPILTNRTAVLDLNKSDDELLRDMTKKTRQYIRKSRNDNIAVRKTDKPADIQKALKIYHETAARAGFALHGDDYYLNLAKFLGPSSQIYVAEQGREMLAFLWLVATPAVSFELYGGVTEKGQTSRANYTLKWQAIQSQKQAGVLVYDMNGLLNDGISTFKLGFSGGQEILLTPTLDKPLSIWYPIWEAILPNAKKIIRKIKR